VYHKAFRVEWYACVHFGGVNMIMLTTSTGNVWSDIYKAIIIRLLVSGHLVKQKLMRAGGDY